MTKFLVLFLTLGFFGNTFAESNGGIRNPLIRHCIQSQGQYWVLAPGTAKDYALCVFSNNSAISAMDLMLNQTEQKRTLAINAFLKSITSCSGQVVFDVSDSEGTNWDLCVYSDNSFIELKTLKKGKTHPDNAELLSVLKF